ncbi:prepilin-type N-terminal cleavage/methylation domain-containing protein [Massilia sp. Dwa41.01b]|uniref:GspH/FimT family pseudopilin n=1 Tax=unclassified Massilia TaxID=2609279 RepID=UPI0015FF544F|nr:MULTISPECIES: GspH/FimT family pseudopilin [unclassified Massilia]QNA90771.1 prepilin-type N-terminal cleavage/methylation domain-containing protein [Massilia sp. Dwa41.01b]QNA98008.1 prepilin-type N-terminal cleavage/methylation domain-containing protein [Massilia sp. Se16.2.3]
MTAVAPLAAPRRAAGFTLVEIMVVMVIIGITLGLVSVNAIPSPRQDLVDEAKRLTLLLQLARDEAIVRNRQVAFEATPERYSFLVRGEQGWEAVTQDDLLRQRAFRHAPIRLLLDPPTAGTGTGDIVRVTFGREPVDKPFVLTLASGDNRVAIRADGVGHFTVE